MAHGVISRSPPPETLLREAEEKEFRSLLKMQGLAISHCQVSGFEKSLSCLLARKAHHFQDTENKGNSGS